MSETEPELLALFHAALQRTDPDERSAYLAEACEGNLDLRTQVEALLAAHGESQGSDASGRATAFDQTHEAATTRAEDLLLTLDETTGSPVRRSDLTDPDATATAGSAQAGTREDQANKELGKVIAGRYELMSVIGEGGMGTVYLANQSEPVKRQVALKLIKSGMDSRSVLARFDAERQALALMDHPNIARIYDGGVTESGQPYFVMELVSGVPLTEYCDTHRLSVAERLPLFVSVCQAVQHAHQKGIIHRDLKPANVLVTEVDGKPAPKVIDFGVAKAIDQKLTDLSFVDLDIIVGTPAYMSPEQADPTSMDIDTRTDVYALGVILYELLVGSPPIDTRQFKRAAILEMLRMIREVDPPRPSTRLSTAETLPVIAANRSIDPARLSRLLRGELDWVVMKALEKDRTRRYDTANGLARDIQRYLSNEVVEARPPSQAYRWRKFMRRHRVAVTAASLVALALLLGLVGTAYGLRQAIIARDGEASAKIEAQAESKRALKAEAETRQRAADLKLVADFQAQMLAQIDPTTAGVRLFEDVRSRYEAALAKAGVPEADRKTQSDQFSGQWSRVNATDTALALIDTTILKPAVAAIDRQFVDHPTVAASLRNVLARRYYDLGLYAVALELEKRTLADRRRVLGDDHPDTILSIGNLGEYHSFLDHTAEAQTSFREALDRSRRVLGDDDPLTLHCMANLGNLLQSQTRLTEAEPLLRDALERRRKVLGDRHIETLSSLRDWANLLKEQGKLKESEQVHLEVLAGRRLVLGDEDLQTLESMHEFGALLHKQGRGDEAAKYFREVVDRRRRVLGEVHPLTLSAMQSLGAALDGNGQSAEAEALFREALAKQRRLLGPDHGSTLASLGSLATFLMIQDRLAEAEPLCRETLERRSRTFGKDDPATLIATNVMGQVLILQNKVAEGEPYWRDALTIAQRVLGPAHPDTLIYNFNLGALARDQKKFDEAEQRFREIVRVGTPAIGADHPIVLTTTRNLAKLMLDQKRNAEAADLLAAAEAPARKAYTGSTEPSLGSFLELLGRARARQNQFAAAEPILLESHAIALKTRGPEHAQTQNSIKLLTQFYTAWDKAEPNKGHATTSAAWTAKLSKPPAPTTPTPEKK